MPRRWIIAPGLAAVLAACGCGSAKMQGNFRASSLGGNAAYLDGTCQLAFYGDLKAPETSFVLSSVPLADLVAGKVRDGLIIHVDLLWMPSAGKTPMDISATNVSIRYIVFANGEVGVYGGAGFALPRSEPGDTSSTLTLWDASMSLQDSTAGFVDLLSPARLTGTFTARHDTHRAQQIRREVNKLVTTALGRNLIVSAPRPSPLAYASAAPSGPP